MSNRKAFYTYFLEWTFVNCRGDDKDGIKRQNK